MEKRKAPIPSPSHVLPTTTPRQIASTPNPDPGNTHHNHTPHFLNTPRTMFALRPLLMMINQTADPPISIVTTTTTTIRQQLSAIMECADAAHGLNGLVVGDGGCTCPGDVAKVCMCV